MPDLLLCSCDSRLGSKYVGMAGLPSLALQLPIDLITSGDLFDGELRVRTRVALYHASAAGAPRVAQVCKAPKACAEICAAHGTQAIAVRIEPLKASDIVFASHVRFQSLLRREICTALVASVHGYQYVCVRGSRIESITTGLVEEHRAGNR